MFEPLAFLSGRTVNNIRTTEAQHIKIAPKVQRLAPAGGFPFVVIIL